MFCEDGPPIHDRDVTALCAMQVAVTTVTEAERLLFRKLPYPGIYHCVARYGYGDTVKLGTPFVTRLLDKVAEPHTFLQHFLVDFYTFLYTSLCTSLYTFLYTFLQPANQARFVKPGMAMLCTASPAANCRSKLTHIMFWMCTAVHKFVCPMTCVVGSTQQYVPAELVLSGIKLLCG